MQLFRDPVLGEIVVRRSRLARMIRFRYDTKGRVVVSAPLLTPVIYLKRVIASSRRDIAALKTAARMPDTYRDGQPVGREHAIAVVHSDLKPTASVRTLRNRIVVTLPQTAQLHDDDVQELIRSEVAAALRREAKRYLPERLKKLAALGGYTYAKLRFSHAGGRWGSCSSTGTISLNIALMKLSDPLIDYVLIHELCHTAQMNHSPHFWRLVAELDPLYKTHRTMLKRETPHV